jgi:hypothetical protein
MPSPGRSQGPLDPATKVLEMESLGVKVKNVQSCLYQSCLLCQETFYSVWLYFIPAVLCATCATAGTQCEALLGAESDQHGLQFCMGGFGCGWPWCGGLTLPVFHPDWGSGSWQAL